MTKRHLADLTWPEAAGLPFVLVPVGSLEQHGPHLPLDTDTAIAIAVTSSVAERIGGDVVIAPPIAYGSSGEHQSFVGTSSIGTSVLEQVVIELVRSMSNWAGRIVFVNAHGGNVAALTRAVVQMIAEGQSVAWVACATEGIDLHAGRGETSLMLHLRPESVHLDLAEKGNTQCLSEILPTLRSGGVGAVSANGVLGDPMGAHAEEGALLLSAITDDIETRIRTGTVNGHGILGVTTALTHS